MTTMEIRCNQIPYRKVSEHTPVGSAQSAAAGYQHGRADPATYSRSRENRTDHTQLPRIRGNPLTQNLKLLGCIALTLITLVSLSELLVPDSYAQTRDTWYVYVDPLPEYALPYAGNVMYESTQYWEKHLPGLQFFQVDDPAHADLRVQWVKEFGVEHVGYAYGHHFIEVGLGDSDCNGSWSPYSSQYVEHIMNHEIGHVLGYDHVDDPSYIMYPIALNKEYGLVEQEYSTTTGYGHFVPFCTAKDVSSFDYRVSIDDPTYGFDVYVVPDSSALDKWAAAEPFNYYSNSGCFGEGYLRYGGTCNSVSRNSGLLIISPEYMTEPLTSINVMFSEAIYGVDQYGAQPERERSTQQETLADESFGLFVDPMARYVMQYPSSWSVGDPSLDSGTGEYDGATLVYFYNNDVYAWVSLSKYDVEYTTLRDSDILNTIVGLERDYCNLYDEGGATCSGFSILDKYTSVLDSGLRSFNVEYQWTENLDGQNYETFTRVSEIHEGSTVWYILAEADLEYRASMGTLMDSITDSFVFTTFAPVTAGGSPYAVPTVAESPFGAVGDVGTLAVEYDVYDLWQTGPIDARIYGTVDREYAGIRVAVTYTYPDGRTSGDLVSYVPPGNFETSLPLNYDSPVGTYQVMASVGNRIIGTSSFTVVNPSASTPPALNSQTPPGGSLAGSDVKGLKDTSDKDPKPETQCRSGWVQVLRTSGESACVYPQTARVLVERGWVIGN